MIYRHQWIDHEAVYFNSEHGFCKITIFNTRGQKVACLHDLVIYPWMRGNGYGRELLDWAIKESDCACCDALILWHDGEPWVKDWYTRRGFVESHFMESEDGEPCMLLKIEH